MDQIFKNSNHSTLTMKIWALRPNGVKISFGARITLNITYQTFSFRDPCRYLLFECEWPSWNNIKNKNNSIFWIIWRKNDFLKNSFDLIVKCCSRHVPWQLFLSNNNRNRLSWQTAQNAVNSEISWVLPSWDRHIICRIIYKAKFRKIFIMITKVNSWIFMNSSYVWYFFEIFTKITGTAISTKNAKIIYAAYSNYD